MAWNGMVLGHEHGAANCEVRGREQLMCLSGVPEGELEAVSAEDAMAHTGQVLGFGYGQLVMARGTAARISACPQDAQHQTSNRSRLRSSRRST